MPTATKCALLGGTMEMEETDVAAKEDFRDYEDLALSLSMVRGLAEDNHIVLSASKLKDVLQRIREEQTKASDVTQQQSHKKLIQEWYLQNQWGREISLPYSNFFSLNENAGRHCLGVVKLRASESLSIICRTPAAFNIPLNLRSSKREHLFDRLKPYKRRTQSATDLCTFVTGYASQGVPGTVALSPIGQWMVDAIEGTDKAKNLLKSHLSSLVTDMSVGRLKSVDGLSVTQGLDQIHCPPKLSMSSSQKPRPGKRRYGSEIPDKMLASCMSLKSTPSCQSSSFSCGVASQGVLYCTWKSGKPHFEFSVDDRGEAYVANLLEVESQEDSAPDYMYMFHSRSNCSKEQVRYGNSSDLIGKMKVSSRLTLDSNNQKHMETEFVLFASGERHVGVSSTAASRKHKLLPQKMVDMFKASNSTKYKPASRFDDFSRDTYLELSGEIHKLGEESLCENHVPPNLELAAIVMKDSLGESCLEEAVGGWGLKFLKRVTAAKCHESSLGEQNEPVLSVNVLVPAGFHGGPATRNGGPSSLTERWRSGGHCDCGGWDVGCPLTVLNNSSSDSCTSLERGRQEDCKSFDLFTEEGLPTLKMVNAHEGLYFVHFESSLTALQSFAIAVAFIHRQSPTLRSKLFRR